MKLVVLSVLLAAGFTTSAQRQLVKKWESDSLFKVPESVLYDADHHLLYVSNIEGKDSWAKDGLGSIGKMDVNGKIIEAEWITGFNAPKGMGLYHHTLYVADLDKVVVVDLHQGKIAGSIEVPGAVGLNDISIDPAGVIYVTDSRGKKLYRIQGGVAGLYLENLKNPNGILVKNGQLYLLDNGGLHRVNADKTLTLIVEGMEGGVDGVENLQGDEFIVSTWAGVVYFVDAKAGTKQLLFDGRSLKINSADIGLDPLTKTIFVPTFWKNTVVAYEVK